MKILFFYFVILLFVVGCVSKQENSELILSFDKNSFKKTISLSNPKIIALDDLSDPTAFFIVRDSLILIQNQAECEYLIEIYSLERKKKLGQFAKKGNGPNEFTNCFCYVDSSSSSHFYLKDGFYWNVVNIDSTLLHKKLFIERKIVLDSDIHPYSEICIDSDRYLGYNRWFLDDICYNNEVEPLKWYSVVDTVNKLDYNTDRKYKYHVSLVNNSHIFMNDKNKDIWLVDSQKDVINIFNNSLQLKKKIIGPDVYSVKYIEMKSGNMPIVYFADNRNYRSYSGFTKCSDYIYLIYEGINGKTFDPEHLPAVVDVFQFDWNGNPICRYSLDRYVYCISISSGYIYCATRKSVLDETQFVRYKM